MSVSPSMPFSRSIVRTASMISRVMSLLPFVDQVAPDDLAVRDSHGFRLRADGDLALTRIDDLAAHAPFRVRAKGDAAADDAAEVLRCAQRSFGAGRRDRDVPLAPVVDQEVGHAGAELVVDTAHVVDVHGEPVGLRQLDGEHLRLRKCGLDLACYL